MTTRERFKMAFSAKAKPLGRRLMPDEILEVCDVVVGELEAEWAKRHKERKKAGIDERAQGIYNLYPRREGGTAALLSISKAIERDGYEKVMEGTTEYASAVARWSPARKRTQSGASALPMPTTWYNGSRYMDDRAAWWEGTGGKPKADKVESLPEPEGWRFAVPDSRYVRDNEPWSRIDLITQQWIINQMKKENTA